MQIRGGRGYETADSLRARGEKAIPVERMMRDSRINLIFEGSSEIMRLFIAREAVDAHFSIAFPIVAPESSFSTRIKALVKATPFYVTWYPARWIPSFRSYGDFGKLAGHMRFADRTTRKLGRSLFHAMVRFGPKLERKQMVLFRAVDIGAELYAMAASCSRAVMLSSKLNQPEAIQLADAFCAESRERIAQLFRQLYGEHDEQLYTLARSVLQGEHAWLEQGLVDEAYYHDDAAAAMKAAGQRQTADGGTLVTV
jgi:alkylation response protein AidB-like acyl-CoA dehydrogenase